jgi:acetyltransferase-like isoleucine patch superfamily enzyme
VTIYPGVTIEEGCIVQDGTVLGRMPIANRTTSRVIHSAFESVRIGAGSVIGANAVIYTGTVFGKQVLVGDLASIREGCRIGDGAIIGRGVMALYNCRVGRFSRIQDQVHLVGNTVIEAHVFVGMGVVLTNDNEVYLSRFGICRPVLKGPKIRRLAVIGSGATILPNVEIGEGALVGAGALVTKDVPPWTIVAGLPARIVREVPPSWRTKVLERALAIDDAARAAR